MAVAVAVEEGLVTPVIRAAQKKSLREISDIVKDLAARARGKKLKPEEYAGRHDYRLQSRAATASRIFPRSSIRLRR